MGEILHLILNDMYLKTCSQMFGSRNSDWDIQRYCWMLIVTWVPWHLTFSWRLWPSCDSPHQHSDIYRGSRSHDRNPALINYPNKRMHKCEWYRNHLDWEMLHDAWATAIARIPKGAPTRFPFDKRRVNKKSLCADASRCVYLWSRYAALDTPWSWKRWLDVREWED